MEIRPENLSHGTREEISLEGETLLAEPMGSTNLISVKVGENELKLFLARPPREGDRLNLSFSPRNTFFFDARNGLRLYP